MIEDPHVVAHQIGVADAQDEINKILARSQNNLTTPESVRLCRVALANYFGAAHGHYGNN